MARSDDASLRPAWGSWLVASVVMAIPLAWVGSQALEEPLYVAGSHLVVRAATYAEAASANADIKDELRSGGTKGHGPLQHP